jgi:hypothetical protein
VVRVWLFRGGLALSGRSDLEFDFDVFALHPRRSLSEIANRYI